MATLADQLRKGNPGEHVLVGYHLHEHGHHRRPRHPGDCETDADGYLNRVVEHSVQRLADGTFEGSPWPDGARASCEQLSGDEPVSMNLWGFAESMLDELDDGLDAFDPETAPHGEGKAARAAPARRRRPGRAPKAGRASGSCRRTVAASGSPTPTICLSSARSSPRDSPAEAVR